MKKLTILSIILTVYCIASSCATFILDDDVKKISSYEKYSYVMLKDVVHDRFSIKKGTNVKLIINVGDYWVKVYAYSIDMDFLKLDRVLILFLFNDDFPQEKFDIKIFEKELFSLIKRK